MKRVDGICPACGEDPGFVRLHEFVSATELTPLKSPLYDWRRGIWLPICPICDPYLLMRGTAWGIPFYSTRDLAVISIADYDHLEMQNLLEFGALPFTRNALACALHISGRSSAPDNKGQIEPLDSALLGPTGIPDDSAAHAEWLRQLEILSSDLPERFDRVEIDTAMRHLVRQVPNEPTDW